jgi:hypothetical protein
MPSWFNIRWELSRYLRQYAEWFIADPLYFFAMIGFMLLPFFIISYIMGLFLSWLWT